MFTIMLGIDQAKITTRRLTADAPVTMKAEYRLRARGVISQCELKIYYGPGHRHRRPFSAPPPPRGRGTGRHHWDDDQSPPGRGGRRDGNGMNAPGGGRSEDQELPPSPGDRDEEVLQEEDVLPYRDALLRDRVPDDQDLDVDTFQHLPGADLIECADGLIALSPSSDMPEFVPEQVEPGEEAEEKVLVQEAVDKAVDKAVNAAMAEEIPDPASLVITGLQDGDGNHHDVHNLGQMSGDSASDTASDAEQHVKKIYAENDNLVS